MDRLWDPSERRVFAARFEHGPHGGTVGPVQGLEFGQPPDLLFTQVPFDGVYVLAGGPRPDGSLPYWWLSRIRLAAIRARGEDPVAGDGTVRHGRAWIEH
jgi:hypothetical protein